LDVSRLATLAQVVCALPAVGNLGEQANTSAPVTTRHGPVLFKSCGWAGWDLAAARLAVAGATAQPHP
ncbi:MAG: hypothetical protein K2W33_17540, partial [Burkholderiales bacterium]|nr:hypothetical protein [Burkholderiales bacterium]